MTHPELQTRWFATLQGDIVEPVPIGDGLLIFGVATAELDGPRVQARAIEPSGDWIRVTPEGNWKLDVRLLFQTADGAHIYCYYTGTLKGSPELFERVARGERVDGSEMYFRSTPCFETYAPAYRWLNDIVCVASMREFGGGRAVYDVFEVL